MDWVINTSSALKTHAELMERKEGLTYERGDEKRGSFAWRSTWFIDAITNNFSGKLVRNIRNCYGAEV